jgi:hypothetical protein
MVTIIFANLKFKRNHIEKHETTSKSTLQIAFASLFGSRCEMNATRWTERIA